MTIKDFITSEGITATVEYADDNPSMPDSDNMNHYRVTLHRGRKQLTTPFSQGYGITGDPTAESVLECLVMDAQGIENARDFADWAGEYGYNTDSRAAEKSFRLTLRQANKLRAFLGDSFTVALATEGE